jgi:hypothetical protein
MMVSLTGPLPLSVTGHPLLPLDGGRRLAGYIINYARYIGYFIDNTTGNEIKERVRQLRPAGRHEVNGFHSAQGDHMGIAAAVTGDTDGPDWKEDRKGLADRIVQFMLMQFLAVPR